MHKPDPIPQAVKNLDAKAAVDKERDRLERAPARHVERGHEQERGHRKGTQRGKHSSFATLMDYRHLKNSELEKKFQKYNGRVVIPGDVVKDDSGSYAVFTITARQRHE